MRSIAAVAVALAAGVAASHASAQPALGIGTSPQGTLTYQIGAAYGQAANEALGRQARVQPQSGTGVMVPLVDSGELDIGFVNTLEITDRSPARAPSTAGHRTTCAWSGSCSRSGSGCSCARTPTCRRSRT